MRSLVVTPTYQEAENVGELLHRVRREVPLAHILIIDDNSPDGTADIAEDISEQLGAISVLRRPAKAGLGSAYRQGFRWGIDRYYDLIVEMDADLSHDPAALPTLLAAVESGADMVIGSRYVAGGSVPDWNPFRRGLSRWGNRYASAMLRLGIADATSGYRAYRAETIQNASFERIRADGYAFQIAAAYRVHQIGGTITEVPIHFADRTKGRTKMSAWIVVEALLLVTGWGIRDRLFRRSQAT